MIDGLTLGLSLLFFGSHHEELVTFLEKTWLKSSYIRTNLLT